MVDTARREIIAEARTIVVKIGTSVLTAEDGTLNHERLGDLIEQIIRIKQGGRRVVVVSSGAIGAGVGRLELKRRPDDLPHLQAAAAVGQCALMGAYEEFLRKHGSHAAQVLLTADDFDDRKRYLNVRNTILTLFEWGCVPIVNENDTVSVAEIKVGDNDHLAALVTNLLQAPLLILLTDVDGLFSGDPKVNQAAQVLQTVPRIDDEIFRSAEATKSTLGTGGMPSKLRAARLVTTAGESAIIANGRVDHILNQILNGNSVGTLFLPRGGVLSARRRWIGLAAQPRGGYVVDAGARRAVELKDRSLLPIGVVEVTGDFEKGDIVDLSEKGGSKFARGLTNYSSSEARQIIGLRSEQVIHLLGRGAYDEMIHRDNLVVV